MADYKKAEITVRSVIDELSDDGFATGEPEITVITAEGKVARDGKDTTLEYTEKSEGGEVKCRLTLSDNRIISLVREGAVECRVDFEEGKIAKTLYSVPPYSFDMTVDTKRIRHIFSDLGGKIDLIYLMNVGGRNAKVNMKISFKIK